MDKKGSGKDRKGGFSMKKSKILVVVLIGLLLAVGMVLASCDKGPACSNICDDVNGSWNCCPLSDSGHGMGPCTTSNNACGCK